MMFLIGRKRGCARRNPRLAAVLGLFSAMMMTLAAVIERRDGAHWPIALAAFVCIGLIALVLIRLVAQNRDRGGE
jgi:hypothetical protein